MFASTGCDIEKKALADYQLRLSLKLNLAMSYSHTGTPALPSAQTGFTSEFEMGSGGTQSLLSPENWSEYRLILKRYSISIACSN